MYPEAACGEGYRTAAGNGQRQKRLDCRDDWRRAAALEAGGLGDAAAIGALPLPRTPSGRRARKPPAM